MSEIEFTMKNQWSLFHFIFISVSEFRNLQYSNSLMLGLECQCFKAILDEIEVEQSFKQIFDSLNATNIRNLFF